MLNNEITSTLAERGSRYGHFHDNARTSQAIKKAFHCHATINLCQLPVHTEALHNLAGKLGRMLSGDPWYEDNIVDAIGFLTLLLNHVRERNGTQPKPAESLQAQVYAWQKATFSEAHLGDYLAKLQEEAGELDDAVKFCGCPAYELADCAIVLMGIAGKLGIDLGKAIHEKMKINKARTWKRNSQGVYRHE